MMDALDGIGAPALPLCRSAQHANDRKSIGKSNDSSTQRISGRNGSEKVCEDLDVKKTGWTWTMPEPLSPSLHRDLTR